MEIKKSGNLGLGVDIEEIKRFSHLEQLKDKFFLDKIYTKKELAYCFKKANPGIHLAGRFVAKEAVFKALTAIGQSRVVSLKKIEILSNIDNVPEVVVNGLKKNKLDINLSISHCASKAIAFVLIVNYEEFARKS